MMEILYLHEHLNCVHYEPDPGNAQIEILTLEKGQKVEMPNNSSSIVFFLRGDVNLILSRLYEYKGVEKEFVFLSGGSKLSFQAFKNNTAVIIFRMTRGLKLCDCYSVEKLYTKEGVETLGYPINGHVKSLCMNKMIITFLERIEEYVTAGLCCRHFFDLKIKEFFYILRICYLKEQLEEFFSPALTTDLSFSEHVHRNLEKCLTARQLAASLNMTPKSFLAKFKVVFGTTPYQWMKQYKIRIIHSELMDRDKPLKQIAVNNGFTELSQFSAFCKKELGLPPSTIRKNSLK